MPYRDAIESVLRRCEQLRARIEKIEGGAVEAREVRTVAEALAWEAALRTRLEHLDLRADQPDVDELAPVVQRASDLSPPTPSWRAVRIAVYVGLVAMTVLIGIASWLDSRGHAEAPPPKRSYLLAGDVASAHHHGDRCTVAIDVDHRRCDLDVICPSIERRFRADVSGDDEWVSVVVRDRVELDGRRGRLTMLDERNRPLEIELDEWR